MVEKVCKGKTKEFWTFGRNVQKKKKLKTGMNFGIVSENYKTERKTEKNGTKARNEKYNNEGKNKSKYLSCEKRRKTQQKASCCFYKMMSKMDENNYGTEKNYWTFVTLLY